jgi:hypothetical protein
MFKTYALNITSRDFNSFYLEGAFQRFVQARIDPGHVQVFEVVGPAFRSVKLEAAVDIGNHHHVPSQIGRFCTGAHRCPHALLGIAVCVEKAAASDDKHHVGVLLPGMGYFVGHGLRCVCKSRKQQASSGKESDDG